MTNKYTIMPIILCFSINFVNPDIIYSRIPAFWIVKLIINKQAIVITAGFEKPDNPSLIDIIPVIKRMPRMIRADTSTGNISVEKSKNAIAIMINANMISKVIYS
jgi:hypothetical protein